MRKPAPPGAFAGIRFGEGERSARFDPQYGVTDIRLPDSPALSLTAEQAARVRGWLAVEFFEERFEAVDDFTWGPTPWPRFAAGVPRARRLAAFRGVHALEGRIGWKVAAGLCVYEISEGCIGIRIQVVNRTKRFVHAVAAEPLTALSLAPGWHVSIPTCGGWAVGAEDFPEGFRVSLRYPVKGSLQWLEVFSAASGLSLGTLDRLPLIKDFVIRKSGGALRLGVSHPYLHLAPGGRRTLPPVYVRLHGGGWQGGAEWYRRWLRGVVSRRRAPHWLVENPVWSWVSAKKQYAARADTPYHELPARSELLGRLGLPLIQVAAWFEHGHDTRYPDFAAGDSLGGEDGLRRAVEAIHSAGRFAALYTNGRCVDPLSEALARQPGWADWLVQAPRGRRYRDLQGREVTGIDIDVPQQDWDPEDVRANERYGEVVFGVMCPSVRKWRRLFSRRLAYLARELGIDGIYIDQVLGAMALPCYGRNHGHGTPNQAWAGYHKFLKLVRRRVKTARPGAYLATEGISDILSGCFDIVQSHNDWRGEAPPKAYPMPELLRFTLPGLLQACGPVYDDNEYLLRLAHAAGSGLDVACHAVDPGSEFAARLAKVASWRARFGKHTVYAEPLACDPAAFPRHRATALRSGDSLYLFTADLAGGEKPVPMEVVIRGLACRELRPVLWEDERVRVEEESRAPSAKKNRPLQTPGVRLSRILAVRATSGSGFTITLPPHAMGFLEADLG